MKKQEQTQEKAQKKKQKKKRESGRSMVEMVGVLAITGLITAGAFILIRAGLASQKRSRAADEVSTIVASVRNLSAERDDFDNLPEYNGKYECKEAMAATLAGAMLGGTLAVATPFSNDSCYYVSQAFKNPNQFQVVLVNIPANDCTVLAARAWAESVSAVCNDKEGYLVITYGKN